MTTKHPLFEYRKKREISQEALAAKVGVRRAAVCRWETGRVRIPADRAIELEKTTGIPREVLRPDLFLTAKKRAS